MNIVIQFIADVSGTDKVVLSGALGIKLSFRCRLGVYSFFALST